MIESVDVNGLRRVFGILSFDQYSAIEREQVPRAAYVTYSTIHHFKNFVLHGVKILSISRGRATDDVVDLDIIVFAAHSTAVHSVRKLDKDGVLLHNPLNVLASNTNDSLVVLIGDVERDRRGHFLLDHAEASLHKVVVDGHDVDVEIVLVEPVKDDLYIA
jgi:hypothetical protein